MVQRYLATSTNVQSRDKAASCLSQPTSRLPSQMSSMYGQSTTSTTPCMFSYAWHIIGYDWLSRFKKKRSLISEFKSTNDCRPEEGREGGQEGPLSLCLDEVKVRRGGGTHTHKWRRVTQCFANVHARHTHTHARTRTNGVSAQAHTHTLWFANTSASCQKLLNRSFEGNGWATWWEPHSSQGSVTVCDRGNGSEKDKYTPLIKIWQLKIDFY